MGWSMNISIALTKRVPANEKTGDKLGLEGFGWVVFILLFMMIAAARLFYFRIPVINNFRKIDRTRFQTYALRLEKQGLGAIVLPPRHAPVLIKGQFILGLG